MMNLNAGWIQTSERITPLCPVFRRKIGQREGVKSAVLKMTAIGTYEAVLNGKRISDYVLAPGWTSYKHRLQVQEYDITALMGGDNELAVTVGDGWYRSPMVGWQQMKSSQERVGYPAGILAELTIIYEDGNTEVIGTDTSWEWGKSPVRMSQIYDGESYDASFETKDWKPVKALDWSFEILIPQEGEKIVECSEVAARKVFTTPAGETVVDFGQEVTGYVQFTVDAKAGDEVHILHGEVLDQQGNFYNANYRSAKAELTYICRDGLQTYKPHLTFYGFRFIKLDKFPGEARPEQFKAIQVSSDLKKTGNIVTGSEKINQLFSNVLWGQKGNYLDVPTDCPQRDERLGWTGDAAAFVRAGSYNYDVEKFFIKWLKDLAVDQLPNGRVGNVIPDWLPTGGGSTAWGDAATICPWTIYMTYGREEVLRNQFESMKKWVAFMDNSWKQENVLGREPRHDRSIGTKIDRARRQYLWIGDWHFGDWLGLDAPVGSYKGSSDEDFIASAYFAYSTELVIKAGRALGEDVSYYEDLHQNIVKAFREEFPVYNTQTEHVLAIQFGLAPDPQAAADELAKMVHEAGDSMKTGFVGTCFLLHVLAAYGHADTAYSLLLREAYPSWLYAVNKGATTIWEHWDGIMENGEFWSTDMNSFNHYAYGAVMDWIYEKAAGINPLEPGFAKAKVVPMPDERLGWLEASIQTRHGLIRSKWCCKEDGIRYEIENEMPAVIVINGREEKVAPGLHTYWTAK